MKIDLLGSAPSSEEISKSLSVLRRKSYLVMTAIIINFALLVVLLSINNPIFDFLRGAIDSSIFIIASGCAFISIYFLILYGIIVDSQSRFLLYANDSVCNEIATYMTTQEISDYIGRVNQESRRLINAEVEEIRRFHTKEITELQLRQKLEASFNQVYGNSGLSYHETK